MSPSLSTRIIGVALTAVTVVALSGCVWPGTTPASTPGAISTPTESPTATITPGPTSTTGTQPVPVSIACSTLIPAQAMYDFNPNFTLQANYAPKSGTAAFAAKTDSGTACSWINDTSGDTLTVSVARPGSDEFAKLKASASAGTVVSGYGDAAYFSKGRFDIFSGRYWIVAQSTFFASAADASGLVKAAFSALP